MKNRMEKEDKLIENIMKDFQMESPSVGFTENVMRQIESKSSLNPVKTEPLISRGAWIGVAASLSALILFIIFGSDNQLQGEPGWLAQRSGSLNMPSVEFSISDLSSRLHLDSPTLFWICIGIAGIAVLAILERLLENFRTNQFILI